MSQRVFYFHYTLKDANGQVIESSFGDEPLMFLEGHQNIIPGLEVEVIKMNVGDKKNVFVKAADAYGNYEEEMVLEVPADKIPEEDREVGVRLQAQMGDQVRIVTITDVADDIITVDGNHPLAGQDLSFDVEITEIRLATPEEVSHGHAHGPNGHHH